MGPRTIRSSPYRAVLSSYQYVLAKSRKKPKQIQKSVSST